MSGTFTPIPVDAHLTPIEIEQHLKRLYNELAAAQLELRRVRDAEIDAKQAYESTRNQAILSAESPKVSRKEGGVSVAERDAWVDNRIGDEKYTLAVAEVQRANAEDYLRMLRQQAEIVRSLGTSVRQAYDMSGRST